MGQLVSKVVSVDEMRALLTQTPLASNSAPPPSKPSPFRYLLGIDAGGSKTQVVLWQWEQAQSLARNQASENERLHSAVWQETFPGINLDSVDAYTANQRIASLLERAGDQVRLSTARFLEQSRLIMGMAGLDTENDQRRAELWLRTALLQLGVHEPQFVLVPDIELALWSATQTGEGIVIIAGTGSNCYGRNKQGVVAKTGGLSHYFSDEGGGFMLGWQAFHEIAKMYDGRRASTALLGQVLAAFNVADFPSLKNMVVNDPDMKRVVAKAAPVVQGLAAQGESVSLRLVQQATADLAEMVLTVWEKLGADLELPVYLVGGLFKDEFYCHQLIERLHQQGLRCQLRGVRHPVVGAVQVANRL